MIASAIPLAYLLVGLGSPYSADAAQEEYKARVQKIAVLHSRAEDIVKSFGGTVMHDSYSLNGLPRLRAPNSWASAPAAGILPDPAPEAIVALEVDNTILVKGSQESIQEMIRLIRLMDVAPTPIAVVARAMLNITDPSGKRFVFDLRGEGHSLDNHAMHLKTTSQSASGPGKPWVLLEATSDADIFTQVIGDNSVRMEGDWYVDVLWKQKGSVKAERLHNVFRTNAIARNGEKIKVASANQKVPGATISVQLELIPRRLSGLDYVPPVKSTESKPRL